MAYLGFTKWNSSVVTYLPPWLSLIHMYLYMYMEPVLIAYSTLMLLCGNITYLVLNLSDIFVSICLWHIIIDVYT